MRCRKELVRRRSITNKDLPPEGNPNTSEYAALLRAAGASGSLADGKHIHNTLTHHLKHNIFLSNLVIHMYGNCGAPDDARAFFNDMHTHDIFSWNFMLKAYVKSGNHLHSLQHFEQMQQECTLPNKFVYVSILALFVNANDIANGRLIHARVASGEYALDMILQTGIVSMYAKCGSMKDARWMFDKMKERDAASWNPMIAGYAQQGLRKEAWQLFGLMRSEGLSTNTATIVTMLSTCSNTSDLVDGKWLHSQIKGTDLEADITVINALIAMYGKCGSFEDANRVFNEMPTRNKITFLNIFTACACEASLVKAKRLHECISESGIELDIVIGNALVNMYGKCGSVEEAHEIFEKMVDRNLVSWNALLAAYAQNGEGKHALQLFSQMLQEGVMPNRITFVSSIDACASLEDGIQGRRFHATIKDSEFDLNVVLGTALIHMYGKCKSLKDARDIFDRIDERDVPCWNAIITVHSQHEESKGALLLFDQMQEEGELPDKITLISMFAGFTSEVALNYGLQLHARIAFSRLVLDVVVGNALINMYGKCGSLKDALNMFDSMTKWDRVTYINIFSVCASKAALFEGHQLHVSIMGSDIEADVVVGNVLINMYGKCGSLEYARLFFNSMPERNVVSWNVILSVYAQNGLGENALDLFNLMKIEGTKPNAVTLVCVLSACSHTGLIDEGIDYFCSMTRNYGIALNADHYNCMIDMLTRAGKLDEAEELIKQMPYEPSVVTWTTLLSACRNQVDAERAARAAQRVLKLSPMKSSTYVTLSNIFTAAGREDEASFVISMMRGLKVPSNSYETEGGSEVDTINTCKGFNFDLEHSLSTEMEVCAFA